MLIDAHGRITDDPFVMDDPNALRDANFIASLDDHIDFDDKRHTYYVDNVKCKGSTSSFYGQFFEKFNADAAIDVMWNSKNFNESHRWYGYTREQLRELWSNNGRDQADLGTRMHELIEWFYNGLISEQELTRHADLCKDSELHQFLQYHREIAQARGWQPFRTELRVLLDVYDDNGTLLKRIPGSIDMLYRRKSDNALIQVDWKRSKEIKFSNRWKSALPPINHLDDCNFVKYSLQQNIYAKALEQYLNEKPAEMYLCICHPNQSQFQLLKLPDLSSEVEAMLKV